MGEWQFLWSEPQGWALLGVLLVAGLALGWAISADQRLRKREQEWSSLLRGSNGKSLENLLQEHLRQHDVAGKRAQEAEHRLDDIEQRLASAKRYAGLVRFDAFEDVGGQQSFALALYDERGYGVVLSSLVGRSECRVYCKRIKDGKSDGSLSDEEQQAIAAAVAPREKVTA